MTPKIKVLHILPELGTGGAERMVVNLMGSADRENASVSVCSLYPRAGRMFEDLLESRRSEVFYLDKIPGLDLSMITKIARLCRRVKPDVVHTHRYALRYALPAAILARVPLIMHTLHSVALNEVDRPGRLVHRLAFKWLGVVPVGISKIVAETAKSYYALPGIEIISNGVPTADYRSPRIPRDELRRRLGVDQGAFVCIHIGRFSAEKNHALLLRAFARAAERRGDLILVLVGSGPLAAKMEDLAGELNIRDKVRLLGARGDVPELLSASDLFVLSSDWEGLPLAVIEAMAAGLPVVATRVGGVPDIVRDGSTGCLVEKGDAEGLCEAIMRMASDPALAARMGENGMRTAREGFDSSGTARAYEGLYRRLLDRRQDA